MIPPMAEETTIQEKILKQYDRLSPDDAIVFRCERGIDCFNSCCRDVSIVLTPYDVLRMKKALGMDSGDFLRQHTISPFSPDQKIPAVLIKMDPETKACPFVTEQGCGIYPHRPWACRMYPLGVAEPRNPSPQDRKFFFLLREEICHGHGQGPGCSIRQWLDGQGLEEYEMMGASFRELMLHEFWDKEVPLEPRMMEMYFMACYDLDRFRRFVFETRFLQFFEIDEARVEAVREDDKELLDLAMQWLRFSLFREKTMKIRRSAFEARAQGGARPAGPHASA
jgi:Fe-S-cluster containining protein